MNREIKFRIWLPHLKTFGNPLEVVIGFDGKVYGFTRPTINDSRLLVEISQLKELRDCVVQQFTGLKDKNGKEIFEGDILNVEEDDEDSALGRSHSYLVEVRFGGIQYKTSFVMLNKRFGKGETLLSDSIGAYTEMEIIGNIFENPEVLTNK